MLTQNRPTQSLPSRIGIIGDVHAHHEHLQLAIRTLLDHGADVLLCTGDLCDGEGCLGSCIELLDRYRVATVRGNHDRWVLQAKARHVPNAHFLETLDDSVASYLNNLPTSLSIETIDGELFLCHGVAENDLRKVWPGTTQMGIERSHELDKIIDHGRYKWMVNGHVHYRTIIHFQALTLINAGTLMNRHRPGFSLLDLEEQQIHGFEFNDRKADLIKTQSVLPQDNHQVFKDTAHFQGDWTPNTLYA